MLILARMKIFYHHFVTQYKQKKVWKIKHEKTGKLEEIQDKVFMLA